MQVPRAAAAEESSHCRLNRLKGGILSQQGVTSVHESALIVFLERNTTISIIPLAARMAVISMFDCEVLREWRPGEARGVRDGCILFKGGPRDGVWRGVGTVEAIECNDVVSASGFELDGGGVGEERGEGL